MFQKKINIVLTLFMTISIIYSCVDDDVCDKQVTPRLTIGFIDESANPYSLDSLFIDKVNSDGTLTTEGPFSGVDSLSIPLNVLSNETVYYLYNSPEALDVDKDIITIKYKTEQKFISKACGLKVTFDNVTYELTQSKNIKELIPNTTEIQNESKNLFITY